MIREKILLSTAISKSTVPIAAIVLVTALISIGMTRIVQGQTNSTSSSSSSSSLSLTPEQKDAICNPNNPASKLNPVNTTESRICGIPVTIKPHTSNATSSSSAAVNATTSAQEVSPSPPPPATSIAPSAVPPSQ